MLETEFGGMNEVFANLYGDAATPNHLAGARRSTTRSLRSARDGHDALDSLHANTQIPKIIGAAREYELTGDAALSHDRARCSGHVSRSTVRTPTAGNSDDEYFFPVDQFRCTWARSRRRRATPTTC